MEYLYVGIFLAVFEITLMLLTLPAELMLPWYSSFYMLTLPTFIYSAFVFRRLFGLKKKGAVLRTMLTDVLQYVYGFTAICLLLGMILGGYFLLAPEKFRADFASLGDRNDTQVENTQKGPVNEFLTGIADALTEDREPTQSKAGDAPQTGDDEKSVLPATKAAKKTEEKAAGTSDAE